MHKFDVRCHISCGSKARELLSVLLRSEEASHLSNVQYFHGRFQRSPYISWLERPSIEMNHSWAATAQLSLLSARWMPV